MPNAAAGVATVTAGVAKSTAGDGGIECGLYSSYTRGPNGRQEAAAIEIFLSYWYQDEDLKRGLEEYLTLLKDEGLIDACHLRRIDETWQDASAVDERLHTSQIVLLLISSSFISSRYILEAEVQLALERHRSRESLVIPVVLRPCQWQDTPIGDLTPLPTGGKPVTLWQSPDMAFLDVANGLRRHLATLRLDRELEPVFTDEANQQLAEELDRAHVARSQAAATGAATQRFDETIRQLKERLRQDGRLQPGDILGGRYRLLQPIDDGYLTQVWRAHDREQQVIVALKGLRPRYRRDRQRLDVFRRSGRQAARLADIDGIVQVVEPQGRDGDIPFQVYEYLAGGDFRQRILNGGLTINQRLETILEVGEALTAAHGLGVIHRDVRPSNILFDLDGNPKLTNFDRVSALDAAQASRTEARNRFLHVAPEALTHGDVAAPADVYGLGMTTLFALHGESVPATLGQSMQQFMAELEVPEATPPVLEKALAWKAEDRWESVREFTDALHRSFIPIRSSSKAAVAKEAEGDPQQDSKKSKAPSIVVPTGDRGKPEGISFGFRPKRAAARRPAAETQSSSGLLWVIGILAALGVLFLITRPDPSEAPAVTTVETAPASTTAAPRDCAALARAKGLDMLYVAGGLFTQGTDDDLAVYGGQPTAVTRSQPQHTVRLSPFWIGTYPITNEQYDRFVQETDHRAASSRDDPRFSAPRQPVVGVSWQDATQFAQWAEMELPSEAQWEAAARGPDGSTYPWGEQAPTSSLANYGGVELATVDAHPDGTGPFGTQGQAGGVWEWCQDTWNENAYDGRDGSLDPVSVYGSASRRVARGGSWMNDADNLPSAVRLQFSALSRHRENVGFRVVCRP